MIEVIETQNQLVVNTEDPKVLLIRQPNVQLTAVAQQGPQGVSATGSGQARVVTPTSGNTVMGSAPATDYTYFVTGAHTMSLPSPSGNVNRYTVKNNHSANITINTVGAELIEGAASISIAPEESVDLLSDGTNWFVN